MATPRSVRFDDATVEHLAAWARRRPGMTASGAAALLVAEGLRMDAHPGVVFRDGPAGRRAGLAAGPDVWEVVRAVRDARAAAPGLGAEELLAAVEGATGVPGALLRVALGYYAAHPGEVDAAVADADAAEGRLAAQVARTRRLLGA